MENMSDQIAQRAKRYTRVEHVVDEIGRTFGVRLLKPSQQLAVQGMAPELEGTTSIVEPDGTVYEVPRMAPLILAASVCETDGTPISFARSRGELNSVLDMLDNEGIKAVTEGLTKLRQTADSEGSVKDAAKN